MKQNRSSYIYLHNRFTPPIAPPPITPSPFLSLHERNISDLPTGDRNDWYTTRNRRRDSL